MLVVRLDRSASEKYRLGESVAPNTLSVSHSSIFDRVLTYCQDLHEFILRVYLESYRGRSVIESKSYVLRDTTNEQNLLPSSLRIRAFRDIIGSCHRVQMSVIFPYEEWHTWRCPACNKRRRGVSDVTITWYAKFYRRKYLREIPYPFIFQLVKNAAFGSASRTHSRTKQMPSPNWR